MSGLIFRLPGFFTDPTIPKLYRDKVITAGTKFCFDAKDTYSFPRQAAPVPGLDVWKNLLDDGPSASFTGAIGFDGGFRLAATGARRITLPASGIAPASADAFVAIIWIKLGAPTGGAAVISAGSSYGADGNQYGMTWSGAGGDLRFHVGGWQAQAVTAADAKTDDVYQFAMSMKKRASDGKYDLVTYVNGVAKGSSVSAYTSIPQPNTSFPTPLIGSGPVFGAPNWDGVVYRSIYDDCSVKSAAELVALDYAENRQRITGIN